MQKRRRDLKVMADSLARLYGANARVGYTRTGHIRIEFLLRGRRAAVVTSLTPSDHRSDYNCISDCKRALRGLTQ